MLRHKTLIVLALVVSFSLSIAGCGILNFRTSGPEDITASGDNLPEWLLLAHRSTVDDTTVRDVDIMDEEDDSSSAVGGTDEDDGIITPSNQQAAAQPSTDSASQPSNTGSSQDVASEQSQVAEDPVPEFGTVEYIFWSADKRKQEAEEAKRLAEERDKARAEEAAKEKDKEKTPLDKLFD